MRRSKDSGGPTVAAYLFTEFLSLPGLTCCAVPPGLGAVKLHQKLKNVLFLTYKQFYPIALAGWWSLGVV